MPPSDDIRVPRPYARGPIAEQQPLRTLPPNTIHTGCCIAGGGPAGIMLGLLLAHGGVEVTVLEKHADFLRDFRGDTVDPSTLEVLWEMGLLSALLERPHQELRELDGQIAGRRMKLADFSYLPTHARFMALMPRRDFLDFLAQEAEKLPCFRLFMGAEVTGLLYDGERVAGVTARSRAGVHRVRADLTVAADGRHSLLREHAGLRVRDLAAPIDVLWFRLSRRPDDVEQTLGHLASGHVLVLLDRGDYWQCAFLIQKGSHEAWQLGGIEELRRNIAEILPVERERLLELRSFDDVKLLDVRVDRVEAWAVAGLLCIGDAAHAMSPIGGVSINLAIQDAVATARLLAPGLRSGREPSLSELNRVQHRRQLPTRVTQAAQVLIQERFIRPVLERQDTTPPLAARWLDRWPSLRHLSARLLGLGFRPERVPEFARAAEAGLDRAPATEAAQ